MTTATLNGHASAKRDGRQKPPPLEIRYDQLPPELQAVPGWLGWRWTWNEKAEKWDKPPICVPTGRNGSSTNPDTWCDLASALAAAEAEEVDGIGIPLGDHDDGRAYCGVDFDNCRDPASGVVDPTVVELVRLTGGYAEISPSGEGIKAFCFGRLPKGRRTFDLHDGKRIELYDSGRYFTVTGHRCDFGADALTDCTDRLKRLYEALETGRVGKNETDLSDRELAAKALQALSPSRADEYDDWIAVGMALHSVDDALLDEWDRWSRQSSKYATGLCAEKWATFHGGGIGLGSLIHWAKEDGWAPPRREQKSRPMTDLGNAERFADLHGDKARHVGEWQKWLTWDGTRWRLDVTGEAERLAKRTVRSIYGEAAAESEPDKRTAISKWAVASEKRHGIAAMLALARTEEPLAISQSSLDADAWALNCANGTLCLQTGTLRPHAPGDLLTKSTGVEYPDEPGIEPVLWMEFLETIFDGDGVLIEFIKRLMGAALVGEQLEHLLPIFWGSGANGKSVFTNTILAALGDYAMQAPSGLLMAKRSEQHPTELADLHGKRLVIVAETKDGQRLDEGLVKSVTGGDRIRARRMREDFWEFPPSHLPVVVTNHKPVVRGDDYGIWRRLRLVPFNVTIPPEKQDRRLPEKLRRELPAILKWMVNGCIAWQRDGLREPDCVRSATDTYRADSDVIQQWIDDCCHRSDEVVRRSAEMYGSYREWSERAGERAVTHMKFSTRLQDMGFRKDADRKGKFFHGIGLLVENV